MFTSLKYTFTKPTTPYIINIKVEKTDKLFNDRIYPLREKLAVYQQLANINYNISISSTIPNYLYKNPKYIFEHDDILNFKFDQITGLHIYAICYKYMTKNKNRCLLLINNPNVLDGLYYLYVYIFQIKPSFVVNIIGTNDKTIIEKYCEEKNIKCEKLNLQNTEPLDVAIIDYLPFIPPLGSFRSIFQLKAINYLIIGALKRLAEGGTLIILSSLFTNVIDYQYYLFLSYFFEKIIIKRDFFNTINMLNVVFIICHNYQGNADMQPLIDLETTILKYNPNRYRDIKISDTEAIQSLREYNMIIPETMINDGSYMHITNFMDIDPSLYKKFKAFQKKFLDTNIYNITQYQIYTQGDAIKLFLEQTKLEAILIAKKYKLPLKEWVYLSKETYNNLIADEFKKLMINVNHTLGRTKKINISNHLNIIIKKHKYLKSILKRVRFSYNYVEQYDKLNFEAVELWFNNRFKRLNSYLHRHQISTNGHKVSRGWTKMYEMLFDMKILEKCTKDNMINIFHTCEAPGNFINAISHYMKTHMPNIKHLWHSQSLKKGLSDQYGFMEQTKEHWDYGLDDSGDITDKKNFSYYYEKYKNCDMYISDCGQGWTEDRDKLGLTQLIYALLLPRIGGGFIIKIQNCAFMDKFDLSLLYIITNKYKHVNICRSNANFWSSEIYIVGFDRLEVTDAEKEHILKCIDTDVYPVKKIKSKFIVNFCDQINKYISQAISFRTYFLFLSENKKIFNANKKQYEIIIDEYIRNWIEKYIM